MKKKLVEVATVEGWSRMSCLLIACLALTAPAVGCKMPGGRNVEAKSGTAKTVLVSVQQDGQTVEVAVGDEIDVQLPAQMGTGFSWQMLTPDAGVLVSLGSPESKSGAAMQPGGAEMQVFRVKVQGQAGATLRFEYRQPWEKDKAAAKTFTVKVHAS